MLDMVVNVGSGDNVSCFVYVDILRGGDIYIFLSLKLAAWREENASV